MIEELKAALTCEVRDDPISKQLYSTDASIYRIEPLAIVLPRSKAELIEAITIASKYEVPIIPRGAATGVVGSCLGAGLIIDCSKYLSKIIEINADECYAIVQPGCVLDRLNDAAASYGLCFGPDTSTSNRVTLGGMVSTNASGSHSLLYGTTQDHVLEIEMVLYSGEVVHFQHLDKQAWEEKCRQETSEGAIYRAVDTIKNDSTITFPKIHRRASGYLIDPSIQNISKLVCGSEGTFGVISEIKLGLSPLPPKHAMVIIGCKNFIDTLKEAPSYLPYSPFSLELVDKKIIEFGQSSPLMHNRLGFLESTPEALLIIECREAQALLEAAQKSPNCLFAKLVEDSEIKKAVWDLRKTGLGLLLSKKSYSQAVGFIEDITVPVDAIAPFIEEIQSLLTQAGKEAGIYGHLGAGCLHIRPYFNTQKSDELATIEELMEKAIALVLKYDGLLSGEHGDGLARSWTNEQFFEKPLYEAFLRLKKAFDPHNRMNPGKVISANSQKLMSNLKSSPTTVTKPIKPYLDYSREGGFALAIDMCNGNGACRKKEGVMCPSFQVTHDEKDSTRARANALQALIHGRISEEEVASEDFHQVMDLCISCKGCKTECPSQIDMAKLKSEYQHLLHQKKRVSLRDRLFASIPLIFHLGSYTPRLVNWLNDSSSVRKLLGLFGISEKRTLPRLATTRFSKLFKEKNPSEKQVVLFVDSFTEFLTPSIGTAAVAVLEALDFSVIAPKWHCCGRTLISKGFLPEAKQKLEKLIDLLYPYAAKGLQIVGLEPSCILTLADEIRDFGFDQQKVDCITRSCITIDQFLFSHLDALVQCTSAYQGSVKVHGHCHQKSLVGMKAECAILRHLVAKEVVEIPSGCCGMAGSFGYEKEHALVSEQIGNLVLFPHIAASDPDTVIIASGTSCRAQIEAGTEKKAMHLVEFINKLLK